MEIQVIKQQLKIETVLSHYNLHPNKNQMLNCPFHKDRTPSMQIYPKTNTYCCFSSNCTAGTGDAIQFVELKEGKGKHQALEKAKEILGMPTIQKAESPPVCVQRTGRSKLILPTKKENHYENFRKFKANMLKSKKAQEYLKQRHLNYENLEVGYNATAYKNLKNCVVLPLKDQYGKVVSLYGRSVAPTGNNKHHYTKNREGIYPNYPSQETKKLILTESIIDAATLIQVEEITKQYEILALYGTNGLTAEHAEAASQLKNLDEIILWLDGDEAGIKASEKHAKYLQDLLSEVKISIVKTPKDEDINSLLDGHDPEILTELINGRIDYSPSINVSTESPSKEKELPVVAHHHLNTTNPEQLIYSNKWLTASVWGGIDMDGLSRLRVSLQMKNVDNQYRSFRDDVNLYSHAAVKKLVQNASEILELPSTTIREAINELTEELEAYRMEERTTRIQSLKPKQYEMTKEEVRVARAFLEDGNLVKNTLKLITKSGLVGETRNGLLLFFLYLSRLTQDPLHAIIFGKSGSGKTYLQKRIADCLPEESVRTITSLTENTLYYSTKGFWKHKVLLIEDLEGVYQAFLPLREFMSNQSISKLTTDKDAKGNNVQKVLTVEGPICVSGATTQASIYEDNANRSFLLHIDESPSHLNKVMEYQRKMKADLIDELSQEESKQILKNSQRLMQNIRVVNPYAMELKIPALVFKKLRTNMHYLKLIEIITFYHQYQRHTYKDKNKKPYIKTEIIDIEWANWLVKDSLLRKSDELSGELRQFFERLKRTVERETSFYSKTIREGFRMNRMKVNRYLRNLEGMGYIEQIGGNRKQGYEYVIKSYEEYEDLKKGIDMLDENLARLKGSVTAKKKDNVPALSGVEGSVTPSVTEV